jgi:hypothetical protein
MKLEDSSIVGPYSEIFDRSSNTFVFLRSSASVLKFRYQNSLLLIETLAKYMVGHIEKIYFYIKSYGNQY